MDCLIALDCAADGSTVIMDAELGPGPHQLVACNLCDAVMPVTKDAVLASPGPKRPSQPAW